MSQAKTQVQIFPINCLPEEQYERCYSGVVLLLLDVGCCVDVLLEYGHGDGGDGEGEQGAEAGHLQEDVHPQCCLLALLCRQGRVDEDKDGGSDQCWDHRDLKQNLISLCCYVLP